MSRPGHHDTIPRILIPWPTPDQPPQPAALQVRCEDPPACPRCGGASLLSAHVPNRLTGSNGFFVRGIIEVALCARCDSGDAAAAPLIHFFRAHPEVTEKTTEEFATLLRAWVTHLENRTVDVAQLEREYEEWRRGEL